MIDNYFQHKGDTVDLNLRIRVMAILSKAMFLEDRIERPQHYASYNRPPIVLISIDVSWKMYDDIPNKISKEGSIHIFFK